MSGAKRTLGGILAAATLLAAVPALSTARAERAEVVRMESFRLLNEGIVAYKRGDYPAAVEALSESSRMALNSFRAYYYLGLALIGDRRYSEATGALEVALDLDPTHLRSHVAMGDAYLRSGDTGEAMASYYRALKLRPEFPAALDGLARVFEARADDDEAIAFFKRAIESNRGFADAYTHLGDLYFRRGEMDEAVRLLSEAVQIRPDYAPGLNRLARAYASLGLANEAVASIRRAIELQPRAAEHRSALGHVQLALGLDSNAAGSFEQALELDPGLPEAREGMAELARRRGDYDEALDQLAVALEDPRIDSRTRLQLDKSVAAIESERDRFDALVARERSGDAAPDDYRALARIFAERRLWSKAAELQRKAPDGDASRETLAYMLFEAGRFREAHTLYSALADSAGRADLDVNNGVTLALLGKHADALAAFERALSREPDNGRALLYKGNALMRLGRREEAVAVYRQYLLTDGEGPAGERVRRILDIMAPRVEEPAPTAAAPERAEVAG